MVFLATKAALAATIVGIGVTFGALNYLARKGQENNGAGVGHQRGFEHALSNRRPTPSLSASITITKPEIPPNRGRFRLFGNPFSPDCDCKVIHECSSFHGASSQSFRLRRTCGFQGFQRKICCDEPPPLYFNTPHPLLALDEMRTAHANLNNPNKCDPNKEECDEQKLHPGDTGNFLGPETVSEYPSTESLVESVDFSSTPKFQPESVTLGFPADVNDYFRDDLKDATTKSFRDGLAEFFPTEGISRSDTTIKNDEVDNVSEPPSTTTIKVPERDITIENITFPSLSEYFPGEGAASDISHRFLLTTEAPGEKELSIVSSTLDSNLDEADITPKSKISSTETLPLEISTEAKVNKHEVSSTETSPIKTSTDTKVNKPEVSSTEISPIETSTAAKVTESVIGKSEGSSSESPVKEEPEVKPLEESLPDVTEAIIHGNLKGTKSPQSLEFDRSQANEVTEGSETTPGIKTEHISSTSESQATSTPTSASNDRRPFALGNDPAVKNETVEESMSTTPTPSSQLTLTESTTNESKTDAEEKGTITTAESLDESQEDLKFHPRPAPHFNNSISTTLKSVLESETDVTTVVTLKDHTSPQDEVSSTPTNSPNEGKEVMEEKVEITTQNLGSEPFDDEDEPKFHARPAPHFNDTISTTLKPTSVPETDATTDLALTDRSSLQDEANSTPSSTAKEEIGDATMTTLKPVNGSLDDEESDDEPEFHPRPAPHFNDTIRTTLKSTSVPETDATTKVTSLQDEANSTPSFTAKEEVGDVTMTTLKPVNGSLDDEESDDEPEFHSRPAPHFNDTISTTLKSTSVPETDATTKVTLPDSTPSSTAKEETGDVTMTTLNPINGSLEDEESNDEPEFHPRPAPHFNDTISTTLKPTLVPETDATTELALTQRSSLQDEANSTPSFTAKEEVGDVTMTTLKPVNGSLDDEESDDEPEFHPRPAPHFNDSISTTLKPVLESEIKATTELLLIDRDAVNTTPDSSANDGKETEDEKGITTTTTSSKNDDESQEDPQFHHRPAPHYNDSLTTTLKSSSEPSEGGVTTELSSTEAPEEANTTPSSSSVVKQSMEFSSPPIATEAEKSSELDPQTTPVESLVTSDISTSIVETTTESGYSSRSAGSSQSQEPAKIVDTPPSSQHIDVTTEITPILREGSSPPVSSLEKDKESVGMTEGTLKIIEITQTTTDATKHNDEVEVTTKSAELTTTDSRDNSKTSRTTSGYESTTLKSSTSHQIPVDSTVSNSETTEIGARLETTTPGPSEDHVTPCSDVTESIQKQEPEPTTTMEREAIPDSTTLLNIMSESDIAEASTTQASSPGESESTTNGVHSSSVMNDVTDKGMDESFTTSEISNNKEIERTTKDDSITSDSPFDSSLKNKESEGASSTQASNIEEIEFTTVDDPIKLGDDAPTNSGITDKDLEEPSSTLSFNHEEIESTTKVEPAKSISEPPSDLDITDRKLSSTQTSNIVGIETTTEGEIIKLGDDSTENADMKIQELEDSSSTQTSNNDEIESTTKVDLAKPVSDSSSDLDNTEKESTANIERIETTTAVDPMKLEEDSPTASEIETSSEKGPENVSTTERSSDEIETTTNNDALYSSTMPTPNDQESESTPKDILIDSTSTSPADSDMKDSMENKFNESSTKQPPVAEVMESTTKIVSIEEDAGTQPTTDKKNDIDEEMTLTTPASNNNKEIETTTKDELAGVSMTEDKSAKENESTTEDILLDSNNKVETSTIPMTTESKIEDIESTTKILENESSPMATSENITGEEIKSTTKLVPLDSDMNSSTTQLPNISNMESTTDNISSNLGHNDENHEDNNQVSITYSKKETTTNSIKDVQVEQNDEELEKRHSTTENIPEVMNDEVTTFAPITSTEESNKSEVPEVIKRIELATEIQELSKDMHTTENPTEVDEISTPEDLHTSISNVDAATETPERDEVVTTTETLAESSTGAMQNLKDVADRSREMNNYTTSDHEPSLTIPEESPDGEEMTERIENSPAVTEESILDQTTKTSEPSDLNDQFITTEQPNVHDKSTLKSPSVLAEIVKQDVVTESPEVSTTESSKPLEETDTMTTSFEGLVTPDITTLADDEMTTESGYSGRSAGSSQSQQPPTIVDTPSSPEASTEAVSLDQEAMTESTRPKSEEDTRKADDNQTTPSPNVESSTVPEEESLEDLMMKFDGDTAQTTPKTLSILVNDEMHLDASPTAEYPDGEIEMNLSMENNDGDDKMNAAEFEAPTQEPISTTESSSDEPITVITKSVRREPEKDKTVVQLSSMSSKIKNRVKVTKAITAVRSGSEATISELTTESPYSTTDRTTTDSYNEHTSVKPSEEKGNEEEELVLTTPTPEKDNLKMNGENPMEEITDSDEPSLASKFEREENGTEVQTTTEWEEMGSSSENPTDIKLQHAAEPKIFASGENLTDYRSLNSGGKIISMQEVDLLNQEEASSTSIESLSDQETITPPSEKSIPNNFDEMQEPRLNSTHDFAAQSDNGERENVMDMTDMATEKEVTKDVQGPGENSTEVVFDDATTTELIDPVNEVTTNQPTYRIGTLLGNEGKSPLSLLFESTTNSPSLMKNELNIPEKSKTLGENETELHSTTLPSKEPIIISTESVMSRSDFVETTNASDTVLPSLMKLDEDSLESQTPESVRSELEVTTTTRTENQQNVSVYDEEELGRSSTLPPESLEEVTSLEPKSIEDQESLDNSNKFEGSTMPIPSVDQLFDEESTPRKPEDIEELTTSQTTDLQEMQSTNKPNNLEFVDESTTSIPSSEENLPREPKNLKDYSTFTPYTLENSTESPTSIPQIKERVQDMTTVMSQTESTTSNILEESETNIPTESESKEESTVGAVKEDLLGESSTLRPSELNILEGSSTIQPTEELEEATALRDLLSEETLAESETSRRLQKSKDSTTLKPEEYDEGRSETTALPDPDATTEISTGQLMTSTMSPEITRDNIEATLSDLFKISDRKEDKTSTSTASTDDGDVEMTTPSGDETATPNSSLGNSEDDTPSSSYLQEIYDTLFGPSGRSISVKNIDNSKKDGQTESTSEFSAKTTTTPEPPFKLEVKVGPYDARALFSSDTTSVEKQLEGEISNVVNQLLLTTHKNFNLLPNFVECAGARGRTGRRKTKVLQFDTDNYPWMARVGYREPGGVLFPCAGTIISHRYILTSANCATRKQNGTFLMEVLLEGAKNAAAGMSDQLRYKYKVEEIIVHPNYNKISRENDIALIRLANPIQSFNGSSEVKPICLPFEDGYGVWDSLPGEGETAYLGGWGYGLKNMAATVEEMEEAAVTIWSTENCTHLYRGDREKKITSHHICAYGKAEKDACRGDAGGPLMALMTRQKIFFQIGVVSYGPRCGYGVPGVYTRVKDYLMWLLDSMRA